MQAAPKPLPDSAAADADDATQQQTQQLASSSTVQPSVAQLPAAATAQQPAAASSPAAAAPTTTATTTPATAKPVVVLLDVNLEAPVLLLPLTSGSDDLLEVDLGTLQLKNLVVWEMRSEDKDRQKLLVDEMQVRRVCVLCASCLCVICVVVVMPLDPTMQLALFGRMCGGCCWVVREVVFGKAVMLDERKCVTDQRCCVLSARVAADVLSLPCHPSHHR